MTYPFTAFAPPVPAGRVFDLYKMMPARIRALDTSGDLRKFLSLFQEVTDLLLYDVDRFADVADPDIAPIDFVAAMLDDLGDPFTGFALQPVDMRRLVHVLIAIYQQKGTSPGMVNAVRFFLGVTITIVEIGFGTWVLGVGSGCQLGTGTSVLGTRDPRTRNTFDVLLGVDVSDAVASQIAAICNYMRPAYTHLRNVVQPTTPPTPTPWELGVRGESILGDNTILHDG